MLAVDTTPLRAARGDAGPALELLSEHLDAVLRHGEALRELEAPAAIGAFDGPGVPSMLRRNKQLGRVAGEALALELSILLRLTQARVVARAVRRESNVPAGLIQLVAIAADTVVSDVPTGDQHRTAPSAFLKSRGVGETGGPLGESYAVAGRIALGDIMDSVAAALDMIDTVRAASVAKAPFAAPSI